MKSNIENFISLPNFDPNLGKNWYKNAKRDLEQIIIELNLSSKITYFEVSLICSILSPANKWHTNLKDTKNVLAWFFTDRLEVSKKPSFFTYGQNVEKAKSYLIERSNFRLKNDHLDTYQVFSRFTSLWVEKNMKALKTLNFYHNLKNPIFKEPVYFTIDRHMLKIAEIEKTQITPKQYRELTLVYLEVWSNSGLNCLFHEFQAVLWANYVFIKHGILHY